MMIGGELLKSLDVGKVWHVSILKCARRDQKGTMVPMWWDPCLADNVLLRLCRPKTAA
jgi:hypothetical protein